MARLIHLIHEAKEDVEFDYVIDGVTHHGTIEAGETASTHPAPVSVPSSPYDEKTTVHVELTKTSGAGFGNLQPGHPAKKAFDAPIAPLALSFTIIDIEGDTETGVLSLDYAP